MSEEQAKFLRWLVRNCLCLTGSAENATEEMWHRHRKALQRQGISREQVDRFMKEHYRGA